MSGADWEMFGRESGQYARAVMDNLRERGEAREEAQREARERYQDGVARFEGWDAAAEHSAVRDALIEEVRRLDPCNPLLDPAIRKDIALQGRTAYIKNGRNDFKDTYVVSSGKYQVR